MNRIWAAVMAGVLLLSSAAGAVTAAAASQVDTEIPAATEPSEPASADATQVAATEPIESEQPSEPEQPTLPTEPDQPVQPVQPVQPTQPIIPVQQEYDPSVQEIPHITRMNASPDGVEITYNACYGAARYRIFVKTPDSLGWERIAETYSLTYTYKDALEGVEAIYTVRAVNWRGRYCSDYDRDGTAFTLLPTPGLKEAQSVCGGVRISWKPVEGAQLYRVFVREGDEWTAVGETASISYLDTGVVSGESKTYTVSPIDPVSGDLQGCYDPDGVTVRYIAAPQITSLTPVYQGVQVSWDPVEGAEHYRLFVKNADGWKALGIASGTSMIHRGLIGGTEYVYTVRAVDAGGAYLSGYDAAGTAYRYSAPPHIVEIRQMGGEMRLYWLASPYAASYRVSRMTYGGTWTVIGSTAGLSFTDRDFPANTLCTYAVQALDSDGVPNTCAVTDSRYYCGGVPADGRITADGESVLFVNGYLRQGYVTEGGDTCYYDASGSLMKNRIVGSDREGYRYADEDGVIDMTLTGIVETDDGCRYLKDGLVDTVSRFTFTYGGEDWNVLSGKARKVVTEEDKVLRLALELVDRVTDNSMTKEEKLSVMWSYCRDAYIERNPRIPHYKGMDWPIIYANDMLINGVGNCMSYGAEFCYIAKAIGYQDCYACNSGAHGWAEIDGLVYDVEWSRHFFKYNYYALSYDTHTDQNYKGAISAGLPWMHIRVCTDYD